MKGTGIDEMSWEKGNYKAAKMLHDVEVEVICCLQDLKANTWISRIKCCKVSLANP